ncbi:sortilin-related receptor-like, partial [Mercenaria mercenaria]|uniref:sortilin-related receptor-like n=1 Tax=Mercenaria mercenaria TaxID=6596 RepID=UPI00234EB530
MPDKLRHNNYCSDVMDTGYLWCFTTDQSTRWEACSVRNDITLSRECNIDIYNIGRQNVTISGKVCLSWKKSYDDSFKSTDYDVLAMDNYCLDPFHDGYSWCFVKTSYVTRNISRDICETGEDTKNQQMNYGGNDKIDFHCDNGKVVPHHAKCNGRFECEDLTDENSCQMNYTGHPLLPPFNKSENIPSYNFIGMFFECSTNEWIHIIAVCDTVIDCLDSSDEKYCASLSDS